MDKKKIVQSIVFLFISIGLFWWVFRGTDTNNLFRQITHFNLFWIGISIVLNLLSQLVRAHRWKLLFRPMPYQPRIHNLFFAGLILAFTNLVIPRGGEFARLGVINRVEKVPFSKLLGMALAERLTDFSILILIFIILVATQFQLIKELLSLPEITMQNFNSSEILVVIAITIGIAAVVVIGKIKFNWDNKLRQKIQKIKRDVHEGFSTLKKLDRKPAYFLESIFLYLLWLMMLYVLFFAYPSTQGLSFRAAIFTFGLSTFAFLLPIQAGMGAWHFVVIQCLLLFGVDMESGKAFSIVAHAAANLIYLVFGLIAFVLLPLLNHTNKA
jgi:uncharacterized protein (TIRG00374 family)